MNKKTLYIAGLILCSAILLFIVLPYGLFSWAKSTLDVDPCVVWNKTDSFRPPKNGYFDALKTLRIASYFPGFRKQSQDLTIHAMMKCKGHFVLACSLLRNKGEKRALKALRDKRDLEIKRIQNSIERKNIIKKFDKLEDNLNWHSKISSKEKRKFCNMWQRYIKWRILNNHKVSKLCSICKS